MAPACAKGEYANTTQANAYKQDDQQDEAAFRDVDPESRRGTRRLRACDVLN